MDTMGQVGIAISVNKKRKRTSIGNGLVSGHYMMDPDRFLCTDTTYIETCLMNDIVTRINQNKTLLLDLIKSRIKIHMIDYNSDSVELIAAKVPAVCEKMLRDAAVEIGVVTAIKSPAFLTSAIQSA